MKLSAVQIAILGACSLTAGAAQAQALSWDPSWSFSGFGTLAYTTLDTKQAEFAAPGQFGGVDESGGFSPDSKLGLQVTGKVNSIFSGTAQLLTKKNGVGTYKPEVEWAFLKAQATPDLAVRVGRIGVPLFAISDFRDVGYSNLWVRPPLEVYGQVPISHFDGADAIYQKSLGTTTITGQVFGGTSTAEDDDTRVHVRHLAGLNVTAEFDNGLTLRAGTAHGKLTADSANIDGLVAILGQTPFASIGNDISANSKSAWFSGIGVAYDQGDFVGNFEYTWRRTDSYVPDTNGWELTGGYRIAKFTPFLGAGKVSIENHNTVNTIPYNAGPQLAALAAGVDGVLSAEAVAIAQRSLTAGVRWDVYKNIALKAQFDHITPTHDVGLFVNAKPGFGNSSVNVFAISADFVF